MIQKHWGRFSGLALLVVSCGGEKETTEPASDETAQASLPLAGGAACTSGTIATGFVGGPLGSQLGTFSVEFDATPASGASDALFGLSSGAPTTYTRLAAIVRFNPTGTIDVRNGGVYAADAAVPYAGGTSYHFRLDVNVINHSYSVHVGSPGASTLLASNYAFRTEQAHVLKLDSYAVKVDAGAGLGVCGVVVEDVCNTAVPSGGFVNKGFAAERRFLTAAFTATPGANDMDGVIGLSAHAASSFNDLAAAVRFSDAGVIEARNGGVYTADVKIGYVKGQLYTFQLFTDVGFHSYTVVLNNQIVLARNFAFRTEQASALSLSNLAVVIDSPAGPLTVCDFGGTPLPASVTYLHDALTLASHGIVAPTGGAVDRSGNTFTAVQSSAGDQLVVSKLGPAGATIWSRSFPITDGGAQIDFVGGGGDGRVAIVGRLDGRINFGGAGNLAAFGGENGSQAFVAKLDTTGLFVDGGVGTITGTRSVVVDAKSNAYLSGYRTNPARFQLNAFVNGVLHEWGEGLLPPLSLGTGNAISLDPAGNVYWAFSPTVDNGATLGYLVKFAPFKP